MTSRLSNALHLMLAACALLVATASPAQEFPIKGKPIRVIVAFPPGIGVDAQARAVTPKLAELLGVPVIIDNRPGGGTLLAATEVLKSAPDGHTIFYSASSTMAQIPHTLVAATFDPMRDFTPISIGAKGPLVLVASTSIAVNDVKELIAWGKANPGKLSYASFGVGTSSHIFGEVFASSGLMLISPPPLHGWMLLALSISFMATRTKAAIIRSPHSRVRARAMCCPIGMSRLFPLWAMRSG